MNVKNLFIILIALFLFLITVQVCAKDYHELNEIGFALLEKGDMATAATFFNRVILENPGYAVAYNNLGSTYYRLKKYDLAITNFEKAITIDDSYCKAYLNLAACYFWKGKFIEAYRYYLLGKNSDTNYTNKRIELAKNKLDAKLENEPNDSRLKLLHQALNDEYSN